MIFSRSQLMTRYPPVTVFPSLDGNRCGLGPGVPVQGYLELRGPQERLAFFSLVSQEMGLSGTAE